VRERTWEQALERLAEGYRHVLSEYTARHTPSSSLLAPTLPRPRATGTWQRLVA
jgi:hypothetical protein